MDKNIFAALREGLPEVDIDSEGRFKYVLIQLQYKNEQALFVRGYKRHEFHADHFEEFYQQLLDLKLFDKTKLKTEKGLILCSKNNEDYVFRCLGGGRIDHSAGARTLFIYGYSQSYGQANHKSTMALVNARLQYPEANLRTSNEGY